MEFTLLKYKPQPWQPTDSLVLAGYMYRTLTDTREREIHRGGGRGKGRPGTCQGSFQAKNPRWIILLVGDPNVKEKANANADDDEDDEDEMDSEDVLKANLIHPGLPQSISKAGSYFPAGGPGRTMAAGRAA